eukprot:10219190-Karenia_brevis.AAC.1
MIKQLEERQTQSLIDIYTAGCNFQVDTAENNRGLKILEDLKSITKKLKCNVELVTVLASPAKTADKMQAAMAAASKSEVDLPTSWLEAE